MAATHTPQTLILSGPTGCGKTAFALQLAVELKKRFGITLEIINADSVAFYQGFDIGSAKPTKDERAITPHHGIDLCKSDDNFTVGDFYRWVTQILSKVHETGNRALILGGSSFYIKALLYGIWPTVPTNSEFRARLDSIPTAELYARLIHADSRRAEKVSAQDRYRIVRALEILDSGKKPSDLESAIESAPRDPQYAFWWMDRDPEELNARQLIRIQEMLDCGWINEVVRLEQLCPSAKHLSSVGYKQIRDHLAGIEPQGRIKAKGTSGLIDEIALAHRQLTKQQRTWMKNLGPDQKFILPADQEKLRECAVHFFQFI